MWRPRCACSTEVAYAGTSIPYNGNGSPMGQSLRRSKHEIVVQQRPLCSYASAGPCLALT
eukprot:1314304-Rhodomonas_salina.3